MPTFTLTDVAHGLWVDSFAIEADDLGVAPASRWSVTKRTLRGGRRDGVDLIEVDNGALSFSVVPTRGMGIWKGNYRGDRLGWDSPVRDGPVNPAFVNLMNWGGLGWLEGFDELLVRCGLENNGAPYEVKTVKPDGSEGHTTFGLHGKIANIPASIVALRVEAEPQPSHHDRGARGRVEAVLDPDPDGHRDHHGPGLEPPGRPRRFLNLGDSPVEMQVLYHWNFGPPLLEEGSRFVAPRDGRPARRPRDGGARPSRRLRRADAGFRRAGLFHECCGAGGEPGRTLAMLRNRSGDRAVVLRYDPTSSPRSASGRTPAGPIGLRDRARAGDELSQPKAVRDRRASGSSSSRRGAHTRSRPPWRCSTRRRPSPPSRPRPRPQAEGPPTIHRRPVEPSRRKINDAGAHLFEGVVGLARRRRALAVTSRLAPTSAAIAIQRPARPSTARTEHDGLGDQGQGDVLTDPGQGRAGCGGSARGGRRGRRPSGRRRPSPGPRRWRSPRARR